MPALSILLDECLDRRVRKGFATLRVKTVTEMGWAGVKNGRLLALAEKHFDVFLTVDRNLPYQLNLAKFRMAIVILHARSNEAEDLLPLVPKIRHALRSLKPGKAIHIS